GKVHNSVAHHDVNEADWSPPLALELRIEPLANGRVTGRPVLRLGGDGCQRVEDVSARHDAHEFAVAHHAHTVVLVGLHEMHDLFEPGMPGHRPYLSGHHIVDLAPAR